MNPLFRPRTIKTIITTAPAVIEGAGRLIKMIKQRDSEQRSSLEAESVQQAQGNGDMPVTMEGLKQEITRLEKGLKENAESDVEQIKLIEQLARQNEALADSISKINARITILTIISAAAIVIAFISLLVNFI